MAVLDNIGPTHLKAQLTVPLIEHKDSWHGAVIAGVFLFGHYYLYGFSNVFCTETNLEAAAN